MEEEEYMKNYCALILPCDRIHRLFDSFNGGLHTVHGFDQGVHAAGKGKPEVIRRTEGLTGNHHEVVVVQKVGGEGSGIGNRNSVGRMASAQCRHIGKSVKRSARLEALYPRHSP